ncbi:hypothetical protein [Spirosoma sp.]|uniref:hypothetical protein n=1 Tax=Spirosoma sp. TaxID=1899569 RepID=UPI002604971F|nr:hypothetical protein [Spirosoma sp.]MCX6217582.1 hypothetical protein [Spirosoma sp.]
MSDFQADDRVRVAVTRSGRHLRNFTGTVVGITCHDQATVLEDNKTAPGIYELDQLTLLPPKHQKK